MIDAYILNMNGYEAAAESIVRNAEVACVLSVIRGRLQNTKTPCDEVSWINGNSQCEENGRDRWQRIIKLIILNFGEIAWCTTKFEDNYVKLGNEKEI